MYQGVSGVNVCKWLRSLCRFFGKACELQFAITRHRRATYWARWGVLPIPAAFPVPFAALPTAFAGLRRHLPAAANVSFCSGAWFGIRGWISGAVRFRFIRSSRRIGSFGNVAGAGESKRL